MPRLLALSALALLVAAALWGWQTGAFTDIGRWAVMQQRDVQNALAAAVGALRRGEPGALATLLFGAFSYGFLHAVGPGHGKALIGGAALGGGATARRMAALALISSLAQSATAVILVYGGLGLLSLGATAAMDLTEAWLVPASALAMAGIAAVLILRGLRGLGLRAPAFAFARAGAGHAPAAPAAHAHAHAFAAPAEAHAHAGHAHAHPDPHHVHDDACGCGHRHGPTPEEVANVHSLRDALALIAGIALRPCTGALILLVIAWRSDLILAGLASVVAMGLGTASFTVLVAISAVAAREAAVFAGRGGARVAASLQIAAGLLVGAGSATLLAGAFAA